MRSKRDQFIKINLSEYFKRIIWRPWKMFYFDILKNHSELLKGSFVILEWNAKNLNSSKNDFSKAVDIAAYFTNYLMHNLPDSKWFTHQIFLLSNNVFFPVITSKSDYYHYCSTTVRSRLNKRKYNSCRLFWNKLTKRLVDKDRTFSPIDISNIENLYL